MNIPLNIDFLQVLLHLLNFVILAGGLYLLLYKPVCDFLEKRRLQFADAEKKNSDDAEENARLRAEYEEKLSAAEGEIAEKRKTAAKEWADTSSQYIKEAKEKADAIIRAAEEEAEDRKEHIMESVQTEIGELVLTATQKLLSDTVTPERNSGLYDEFLRLADEKIAAERAKHDKK